MGAEVVRVSLTKPQMPTKTAEHVMSPGEVAKMQQDTSESLPTEGDIFDLTQLPDGGMSIIMRKLGNESCLAPSSAWNGHSY